MDSLGLRRKDTTKGPPLRILALDGGGVRGYSTLIILQELMHRTFVEVEGRAPKRSEIPKPCEHFDLIVGTGTGGLIALMLGRLRMDIETCKDTYVRLTKRVFETDKTIAGIPYRSTLFKASKLEEAIRECVREHTVFEDEGNDEGDSPTHDPNSPTTPKQSHFGGMRPGSAYEAGRPIGRSPSVGSRYSQIGMTPVEFRGPLAASRWGKPNALLYDTREHRTKTAVTAIYKGTPARSDQAYSSVLLRSYDSRKETAIEPNCTIWQAGRATSATALAFKPIQIGQSAFLDEGGGKYNPSPQALDEAVQSEWPGREVGVLLSIGTGKRPKGTDAQQHMWWEGFVGGGMGDFAEARRRLIAKIEGCEETHKFMLNKHLIDRGVNLDNYYRLNVDVGVGEFGMNEWNRLADISTNTRRYLATTEVQRMNVNAAAKLARIYKANQRWLQTGDNANIRYSWEVDRPLPAPPAVTGAIELPAEDVPPQPHTPPHHPSASQLGAPNSTQGNFLSPQDYRHPSDDDKFVVQAPEPKDWDHHQQLRQTRSNQSQLPPGSQQYPPRTSNESGRPAGPHGSSQSLPIGQGRPSGERPRPPVPGAGNPNEPPPIPPKTPINGPAVPSAAPPVPSPQQQGPTSAPNAAQTKATMNRPPGGISVLPYPDTDGPPGAPPVNWKRKPELGGGAMR